MTELVHRKPVLTLFGLILFHLFLLSIQITNEQGRTLLRSGFLAVLSPPLSALHFVYSSVASGLHNYLLLIETEETNQSLRRKNEELTWELYQLKGFRKIIESESRYRLLSETYGFEVIRAAIIWRGYPMYSSRVLLNAGERHGVRKNSAVITPEGIVGRTIVTTAFSSEVELVIDVNGAAGAVLAESGLQGVVEGDGSDTLLLHFIPVSEKVRPGELLLTSGGDRIYPRGLPIGTVVSAKQQGTYQTLTVKPAVDFSRLKDVAVVVSVH